jgi:hypothetical protein
MFVYFRFADIPKLVLAVVISGVLWVVFRAPLDNFLGQASVWMILLVVLSIGAVSYMAGSFIWKWIVARFRASTD